MFEIGDYVYFPFKKQILHGQICKYAEKTQKYSIEYFDPDKDCYRKASKASKDLTPADPVLKWYDRRDRNLRLLAKQEHIPLEDWIITTDDPRFESYLSHLTQALEIGLDIETLGYEKSSDALHPSRGDIRLIQVYLPTAQVCLVWDLGAILDSDDYSRVVMLQNKNGYYRLDCIPGGKELAQALGNKSVCKYIHNAAFEGLWFQSCFGINLFNVRDTMIFSQMFWAGMARGMQAIGLSDPNSLKALAFRLNLGILDKQDQMWDYGFAVGNRQLNYGANDAKLTYLCGREMERRMDAIGMVQCREAEMIAIPAFADMRYKGFPVNEQKVLDYIDKYQAVIDRLKADWDEEFPGVSPTSGKQAAKAILERYDVDLTVVSKTTGEETDSIAYDILAPYFGQYEILRTLASIGSVVKGLEYLKHVKEAMFTNCYGVTVVAGGFRQLASPGSMGRSGCAGKDHWVQLQTPPKGSAEWRKLGLPRLRSIFSVEGQEIEGKELAMMSFDLSGSHAQIARYMSQDPKLLEALERDIKVHYYTSQGILAVQGINLSLEELIAIKEDKNHSLHDKVCETYDLSKTTFYSGLNGGGATRLQGSLKESDPPIFLPLETCQELVQGNKQTYAKLFAYMYSLPVQANEKNHMIPVWFDENNKPVYWGYYGGRQANRESLGLLRPPGVSQDIKPKYVGQNRGKYSGYLPGKVRFYGELRSPDGGRYFLQKEPDKKGNYQCLLGDATAFMWQTLERTGIKKAVGVLTEIAYQNPEWCLWIPSFLHDEAIFCFKKKYAYIIAPLVCDTIVSCMREVVADFTTEVSDPMKAVTFEWKK